MKYRLKKDLWGKKAGEIINICEEAGYRVTWYNSPIPPQAQITIDVRNPEYFEEVKEESEESLVNWKSKVRKEMHDKISDIVIKKLEQNIEDVIDKVLRGKL